MKPPHYILALLILSAGCESGHSFAPVESTADQFAPTAEEVTVDNLYRSDGLSVDVSYNNFNTVVYLTTGMKVTEYNLTELNIPTKVPCEVRWVNGDFVCMLTWWSQSQSRHIFVPIQKHHEFIYLNKQIAATDSVNNNIAYIDTVDEDFNKVSFKVENLLTGKSQTVNVEINEQNGIYPFYEQIRLSKHLFTLTTTSERKKHRYKWDICCRLATIRDIGLAEETRWIN